MSKLTSETNICAKYNEQFFLKMARFFVYWLSKTTTNEADQSFFAHQSAQVDGRLWLPFKWVTNQQPG